MPETQGIDFIGVTGLSAEAMAARVSALTQKAYEAVDPRPDHPSLALIALAVAFTHVCKRFRVPQAVAHHVLDQAWATEVLEEGP